MVDVNKLLEFAKQKPEGLSTKDLETLLPGAKLTDIAEAINKCLKKG